MKDKKHLPYIFKNCHQLNIKSPLKKKKKNSFKSGSDSNIFLKNNYNFHAKNKKKKTAFNCTVNSFIQQTFTGLNTTLVLGAGDKEDRHNH